MSDQRILVDFNFYGNEIQQVSLQKLSTDPISPYEGQFWVNTAAEVVKYFLNGEIRSLSGDITEILAGSSKVVITDGHGPIPTIDIDPTEISHLDLKDIGINSHDLIDDHIVTTTNPHLVTLDQSRIVNNNLYGAISLNNNFINNLKDPINLKDAATKFYVDNKILPTSIIGSIIYQAATGVLPNILTPILQYTNTTGDMIYINAVGGTGTYRSQFFIYIDGDLIARRRMDNGDANFDIPLYRIALPNTSILKIEVEQYGNNPEDFVADMRYAK